MTSSSFLYLLRAGIMDTPPQLVYVVLRIDYRLLFMLGKHSTNWALSPDLQLLDSNVQCLKFLFVLGQGLTLPSSASPRVYCRPGWPWTQTSLAWPGLSAFCVLGLEECTTTTRPNIFLLAYLYRNNFLISLFSYPHLSLLYLLTRSNSSHSCCLRSNTAGRDQTLNGLASFLNGFHLHSFCILSQQSKHLGNKGTVRSSGPASPT